MPADDSVDFASTPVGPVSSAANSATSEPIERLATEYVERLRKGERPTISSYQQQHPELASGIGDLFPTIAALEGLREEGGVDADPFGKAVLGEFRLLRELGRGGMGVVYLAEQPSLARRVALKVLPSSFARDANLRTRFQREARVVAGMSHPNITPVFAVGEGDGQPWFAMQLLHGVGVDQVINALAAGAAVTSGNGGFAALVRRMRDGVPVLKAREDWQDAAWLHRHIARLVAAAADGLHYAHQRGVLHRDVKPANLILDVDGRVWVNDFGLAKGAGDVDVTSAESITGTLLYLAPERFDGITDRRCDVYSLGLVLRELLTKQTAFPTDSRARLIKAIAIDGVPPVRFHAPNLPADIAAIVDRACAKDPTRRYGDAASFAKDLLAFADSVATAPGKTVEPSIIRTAKPDEAGLPIGRVAVLLGALVGVWWWFSGSDEPVPPPAALQETTPPHLQPASFTTDDDPIPQPVERLPEREPLAPIVERLPTLPPVPERRFSDPPAPVESAIPPIGNVPPAVPLPRVAPEPRHPPVEADLPRPRPEGDRPPRFDDRPPRPEGDRPPPRRPGDPPPPGPGGRPPPPPPR